jgi:hypothetical protein
VANAAYTISDEQIRKLSALGLSDAELLDLTLATALFSALAIIEPISAAVAPGQVGRICPTSCTNATPTGLSSSPSMSARHIRSTALGLANSGLK